MSLNRLHNIFGRRGRIDRRDIDDYGRSHDPELKNAIEQKAAEDGFNNDALEGWEQLGFNTSAMASLDKKFAPKNFTSWYVIGGITAVVVTALVVAFGYTNTTPPLQASQEVMGDDSESLTIDNKEITLDESDVIIPEPIEKMNAAPEKEQVKPEVIINDFHEIDVIRTTEPPMPIAKLPIIDIDIKRPEDREIMRKHEFAKEIYLEDLKLVDYSNYRNEPQIKTRRMILTGVPANMEDENSEELDPIWKDVDIPYMEFIQKSMRIFGRGNYKKALSRFETVLETYERDVNANFYAGVCLFNLGEYSLATQHFDACLDGPYSNFDEESIWMKALSLEHLGKHNDAHQLFVKIKNAKGFYAKQAADKLKK